MMTARVTSCQPEVHSLSLPGGTPSGAAMGPVKSIHLSQFPCSQGCSRYVSGILPGASGRVLLSWYRPCLFYLPLLSFSCLFCRCENSLEHLSCNMLRMEVQKDRRAWNPSDILELLCLPWNGHLWAGGYVDKVTHSLVKPLLP